MRITFANDYKYVTNDVCLYLTNYYILSTQLTSYCALLLSMPISSNMTFTPIAVFGQISLGPMDHCFSRTF